MGKEVYLIFLGLFCIFFPAIYANSKYHPANKDVKSPPLAAETAPTQTNPPSAPTMELLRLLCEAGVVVAVVAVAWPWGRVWTVPARLCGSQPPFTPPRVWPSNASPSLNKETENLQQIMNASALGHAEQQQQHCRWPFACCFSIPAAFFCYLRRGKKNKKQTLLFFSQRFCKNSAYTRFILQYVNQQTENWEI